MTIYEVILILATVLLAALTNVRVAYFLCVKKWKMQSGNGNFVIVTSTVAAIALSAVAASDAAIVGSCLYGLALLAFTIPLIGIIWAYVVGVLKATQLILIGLVSKLAD